MIVNNIITERYVGNAIKRCCPCILEFDQTRELGEKLAKESIPWLKSTILFLFEGLCVFSYKGRI